MCYLPCFTLCSLTGSRCNQQGLGLSGLVHEKAHPVVPDIAQSRLECIDTGCIHRLLVQHISPINDLTKLRTYETSYTEWFLKICTSLTVMLFILLLYLVAVWQLIIKILMMMMMKVSNSRLHVAQIILGFSEWRFAVLTKTDVATVFILFVYVCGFFVNVVLNNRIITLKCHCVSWCYDHLGNWSELPWVQLTVLIPLNKRKPQIIASTVCSLCVCLVAVPWHRLLAMVTTMKLNSWFLLVNMYYIWQH